MKLSTTFITALIENEKPVYMVGTELLSIWLKASEENSSIADFYLRGEEEAKSFEEFILKTYGEFYRELARLCVNEPCVLQESEDTCFVVMDGMSLREGVLVSKALKSKGYETKMDFGFSALPSETLPFREKAGIFMGIFKEINNPRDIRLNGDEKFVWSQFPDVMLDKIQVGSTIISSLEEMYKTTEAIVKELIDKLEAHTILILSDHGYTRSESGFWFTVGDKAKKKLQEIFGSKRYVAMDDLNVEDLIKAGYVTAFGGYYLVNARYVWPVSGRISIYLHGGLSLMECITPLIKVMK